MEDSFAEGLIKGRIAETIFSLMFEEAKEFDVLPLGYEQTTPILAQYQHLAHVKKVLDNIRHAPDFALISHDHKSVYFVEVKYRWELDNQEIEKIAKDLNYKFEPCLLFVATPIQFYFDSCSDIIKLHGVKTPMRETWASKISQDRYLKLLNKFISPKV